MMKPKYREHHRRPSNAKLDEMIEEATVDANGGSVLCQ
jgi:hypothetical protein